MPIQNYQKYMNPIVSFLSESNELTLKKLYDETGKFFQLTELDLEATIPSGRKTLHRDRVGWAVTYLKQAGLVESPRRSYYSITKRGRDAIKSGKEINTKYLIEFQEFREFRARAKSNDDISESQNELINDITPYDALSQAYKTLHTALASELLDRLIKLDPTSFEKLVIDVIRAMGYGVHSQHTGKVGDGGIDGTINEDILGLDVIYLQAKRWAKDNKVGDSDVSSFIGSLDIRKATKGVFITTSDFSDPAKKKAEASSKRVTLINGNQLVEYMIKFGVGVSARDTFIIKGIDENYFIDD